MIYRFQSGETGKCPHCGTTVQFVNYSSWDRSLVFAEPNDEGPSFEIHVARCPSCGRPVVSIEMCRLDPQEPEDEAELVDCWLIWPAASARAPVPETVPQHLRDEYHEAAIVLALSRKASAALSRRCLQSLLREAAKTKSKGLADQIEEVLPTLPGYLQPQLDAVRNIGNFAAHQQKSRTTGEIIDVEPGEAEWNLDVLDLLFDFYFEQPRIAQQKRDALNKKLEAVGKPPMK